MHTCAADTKREKQQTTTQKHGDNNDTPTSCYTSIQGTREAMSHFTKVLTNGIAQTPPPFRDKVVMTQTFLFWLRVQSPLERPQRSQVDFWVARPRTAQQFHFGGYLQFLGSVGHTVSHVARL